MTWHQEELAQRIAEWMLSHGYDADNEGRFAANALLFYLDRYGYAVVPYDNVAIDDGANTRQIDRLRTGIVCALASFLDDNLNQHTAVLLQELLDE